MSKKKPNMKTVADAMIRDRDKLWVSGSATERETLLIIHIPEPLTDENFYKLVHDLSEMMLQGLDKYGCRNSYKQEPDEVINFVIDSNDPNPFSRG